MRLSIDDHVAICSRAAKQAIMGELSLNLGAGLQLKASFAAIRSDRDARLRCAAQIGQQLAEADFDTAMAVASAITARLNAMVTTATKRAET